MPSCRNPLSNDLLELKLSALFLNLAFLAQVRVPIPSTLQLNALSQRRAGLTGGKHTCVLIPRLQ